MNAEALLNKIHVADCVQFSTALPDCCVDLIIADPPYNLGKNFGNNRDSWDTPKAWAKWCEPWLHQSFRVLKDSGSIFVYSIHAYHCYVQCLLYELGFKYRRMVIWHYENGWAGYSKTLSANYEPILWFSKTDKFQYRVIREPYKSADRLKYKITKGGKVWQPHPEGRMAGDVWYFPTLAGRRFREEKVEHPTQKPLALTDRIIQHYSSQGDTVYVPFAGSGTECVSAAKNGRHFLACEINPEYVALAQGRLNALQMQNKSS